MSFSRCLLSSAVLAGTVFCSTTLPLAAFSSKPVTIQLEEKPVFVGQVEEFAVPYLGLAAAVSLAIGAASLATAGWRQSSRKLNQAETQMSTLKQQLSDKEALIEDIKFSQQRLSASGLELFLQEETTPQPTTAAPAIAVPPAAEAAYVVVDAQQHNSTPAVNQSVAHSTVQAATALASAQAFMGFNRPAQAEPAAPENKAELDELLTYLKQMSQQIERMQSGSTTQSGHATTWQQLAS